MSQEYDILIKGGVIMDGIGDAAAAEVGESLVASSEVFSI